MKTAALYLRCSSRDQTVDSQRHDLHAYVARHPDWRPIEYVDEAFSGSKDSRPALNRLMADVRRGKIDVVVVYKYDRFSRSVSHLVRTLDEFRERGIEFVSVTNGLDTSTSSGKLLFHILAGVAEFERDLIIERVRAGQRAAKAAGKHLGRKSGVNRETADRIRQMRSSGLSWRKIAAETGVPRETVRRTVETSLVRNVEV